jgi:hypothetical protein
MPFVSITRLHLRSIRFLPQFFWFSFRSSHQAKRSNGNLRAKFLRDRNAGYWTLTSWKDEASMRAFMMSGAHRRAMPKLLDWCDEAALAHWNQETPELPDWIEAHGKMVSVGRTSKVRNPSPAQQAQQIPAPKL